MSAVEDVDIVYIRKNAIIRIESTQPNIKNIVITLTNGELTFAFGSKEAARAFQEQIAVFCAKDN